LVNRLKLRLENDFSNITLGDSTEGVGACVGGAWVAWEDAGSCVEAGRSAGGEVEGATCDGVISGESVVDCCSVGVG